MKSYGSIATMLADSFATVPINLPVCYFALLWKENHCQLWLLFIIPFAVTYSAGDAVETFKFVSVQPVPACFWYGR